jgi:hypothetical protein
VRNLIDKYLPESEYRDLTIKNDFLKIINREEIPLRQVV